MGSATRTAWREGYVNPPANYWGVTVNYHGHATADAKSNDEPSATAARAIATADASQRLTPP